MRVMAGRSEKTQRTRLLDVFIYGPFMIFYALSPWAPTIPLLRIGLAALGVGTILYNAKNYAMTARRSSTRRLHPMVRR